jgi:putative Holliday junction resolvase
VLALDIGEKRTGVALSDESLTIASPLTVLPVDKKKAWMKEVAKLCEKHFVAQILVGLPLNHHGEEGSDAEKMRSIVAMLRKVVSVPVIEWDERFTTVQAERSLIEADVSRRDRKQIIDKVAASIMLQSYLDSLTFQQRHNNGEE